MPVVEDIDAHYQRAMAAGAEIVRPLADTAMAAQAMIACRMNTNSAIQAERGACPEKGCPSSHSLVAGETQFLLAD